VAVTSSSLTRGRARPIAAPPRAGFFGLLGQGNLGNDGSMEAVLAYLRTEHPDVILDSLCSEPDVVAARYAIPASPLRWYQPDRQRRSGMTALARRSIGLGLGIGIDAFRTASWVRRHEAVIVPGMGVLETTVPMRPWKTPYWMFLLCTSGRLFRTKVALVSVGANVTHHRVTRRLITTAVRRAHYRSYRDPVSRDAMQRMGVNTSADAVYPDVAFALPVPRGYQSTPGSVGIGVMDYSGGNDDLGQAAELRANYLAQMKFFARWLVDNGRPIRLFTSDTADEPVVQEIADDVRAHRPDLGPAWVMAEPARSLAELMQQIALVDTVVATRYHNVLYALLLAKPTLALGYAAKHDLLMADTGLPGFCVPCRSLEVTQMIERFTELECRSGQLRQTIMEHNAAKVRLVEQQFAEMSAVIFPAGEAASAATGRKAARTGAR
jgi:polysaccharide pyruvyl transferase WcaK-like protein